MGNFILRDRNMKIEAIKGELECLDVMIKRECFKAKEIVDAIYKRKFALYDKLEEAKKNENE